jgi:hypothetical protein
MPRLWATLLLFLLHKAYQFFIILHATLAVCGRYIREATEADALGRAALRASGTESLPGKRPPSVALIVPKSETGNCLADLARLLAFCSRAGVEHVAVYDATGGTALQ